jgi:uncharacterized RDD family membrane protein YckC
MERDTTVRGVPPPIAATEDITLLVHRLLAGYREVLELVGQRSGLFWTMPHGSAPFRRAPVARLRPLVPMFAAGHAARATRQLKRSLHGAAVDANDPNMFAREVALLDRFDRALPSVPTRTFLALLVVGLLAVSYVTARSLGGSTGDLQPLAHLTGGVFLLSRSDVVDAVKEYGWRAGPIYFTALGMTVSLWLLLALPIGSFRLKRVLFNACPGAESRSETLWRCDPRSSSGGVYEIERELFRRLGTRPPRELRFDLGLDAALSILAGIVGVYLAVEVITFPSGPGFVLANLRDPRNRDGIQFLGTALLVMLSLARLRQIRRISGVSAHAAQPALPRVARARLQAPAAPAPQLQTATWWRRTWASLLDGLFIYLLLIPIGAAGGAVDAAAGTTPASAVVYCLLLALPIGYVVVSHAAGGAGYASPGKRRLRLAVVDEDGRKPSLGRTLVREVLLKWLLFSPFLVLLVYPLFDYLRPLWRDDGLALHDRMAGTRVVQLAAAPALEPAITPA